MTGTRGRGQGHKSLNQRGTTISEAPDQPRGASVHDTGFVEKVTNTASGSGPSVAYYEQEIVRVKKELVDVGLAFEGRPETEKTNKIISATHDIAVKTLLLKVKTHESNMVWLQRREERRKEKAPERPESPLTPPPLTEEEETLRQLEEDAAELDRMLGQEIEPDDEDQVPSDSEGNQWFRGLSKRDRPNSPSQVKIAHKTKRHRPNAQTDSEPDSDSGVAPLHNRSRFVDLKDLDSVIRHPPPLRKACKMLVPVKMVFFTQVYYDNYLLHGSKVFPTRHVPHKTRVHEYVEIVGEVVRTDKKPSPIPNNEEISKEDLRDALPRFARLMDELGGDKMWSNYAAKVLNHKQWVRNYPIVCRTDAALRAEWLVVQFDIFKHNFNGQFVVEKEKAAEELMKQLTSHMEKSGYVDVVDTPSIYAPSNTQHLHPTRHQQYDGYGTNSSSGHSGRAYEDHVPTSGHPHQGVSRRAPVPRPTPFPESRERAPETFFCAICGRKHRESECTNKITVKGKSIVATWANRQIVR